MDIRAEDNRRWRPSLRHAFVLVAIAGCAAALGSCKDGTSPDDPGFIRVSIDGIVTSVSSAGGATISGTNIDEPLDVVLPASVDGTYEVPAGSYHVVYAPPGGYTIEPGSSNETDVVVTEDDTTDVSFTVVQASGTLRISVVGLDASATGGGSASVLRTDIGGQTPLAVVIPDSATAVSSVLPGDYTITYTPPANHVLLAGQTAVRNVTVAADGQTTVIYEVDFTAPVGTLAVEVTGITPGAANGGSATATPVTGGGAAIVIAIPADGFADTVVAVGAYSVSFTPPAGHVIAPGQTNPQTVNIAANAADTASIDVDSTGPTPSGVVFHSDWSTALGKTDAALRDTDKEVPWTQHVGNGTGTEVVSSSGLDFPSANVLRVVAEDGDGDNDASSSIVRLTTLPVPQVGESLYYRWYIRVAVPNAHDSIATDPETHPIQDGLTIGDTNWAFQILTSSSGTWRASYELDSGPNSGDLRYIGRNIDFQKDVTYRFELQLHRTSVTQFNLHSRVYDAAGTLLFDDDDWRSANGETTLAQNPFLNFNAVANLNGLNAGFNGLGAPSTLMPFTMYYQGAFCVRTDTWCGPYSGGI